MDATALGEQNAFSEWIPPTHVQLENARELWKIMNKPGTPARILRSISNTLATKLGITPEVFMEYVKYKEANLGFAISSHPGNKILQSHLEA